MDLLARIEVDGVCLGGIRLSGVLRPKQVASVGAQTKTRAWAFRLGSSCPSGVSHARCKWLPATCSPYHTSIRARLATPDRSLLPVTSNILPTKAGLPPTRKNTKTACRGITTSSRLVIRAGTVRVSSCPAKAGFVSDDATTPEGFGKSAAAGEAKPQARARRS